MASEQFELQKRVDAEHAEGRDMLAHMAARTRTHIVKAERRLAHLRTVNEAAEGYVKDKYGLDIEDFRKS
jgi:(p)ppGpp synthase/HD superfamily hydrolase